MLLKGFIGLTMSQIKTIKLLKFMNKNSLLKISILTVLCFFSSSLTAKKEIPKKSSDLLNKDGLKGWKIPQGNEVSKWYQVKDNILKLRSGPKKKGSVLWTEKEYQDFEVSFGFRFVDGTIDSGIHLRNLDQIQIGISGSLKRDMTCSPYIPGEGYPVEAKKIAQLLKKNDWNQMRIRAIGSKYTVWLQGKKVMNYQSTTAKKKGPIGIQLHGNRSMAIDFKNIQIEEY